VLLAPLGAGGSGRIWAVARVGQLGFSKRMVLKVMRHDKLSNERARERFDREACLGGRLSHPNVRAVHDLGSHEGRPFMALSWVDASLEELLEHSPSHALDPGVACWIGMQCCSALSAAHEYVDHSGAARPIVHRDVSPGNILLTLDGHALLADLTAPAAEASPRPEAAARFFGSLGYAAPEALLQQACDARADLFSLGAVLFEVLAGTPAFGGDDERSVMWQILEGPSLDLARRAPAVPADLAAIVERCLERRPENRFQSARELRAALSRCSGQQSSFSLELRAAKTMREVLGARIREREEALHLAYQRIAPSPFEHTDTLPIRGAASEEVLVPPASDPPVSDPSRDASHSGAGVALSQRRERRRRGTLWAGALLLLAIGALVSLAIQREGSSGGATRSAAERAGSALPVPSGDSTAAASADSPPAQSQGSLRAKVPGSPQHEAPPQPGAASSSDTGALPPGGAAVPTGPALMAGSAGTAPQPPQTREPSGVSVPESPSIGEATSSASATSAGSLTLTGSPAKARGKGAGRAANAATRPVARDERDPQRAEPVPAAGAARGGQPPAPVRDRESPYARRKRTSGTGAAPASPP